MQRPSFEVITTPRVFGLTRLVMELDTTFVVVGAVSEVSAVCVDGRTLVSPRPPSAAQLQSFDGPRCGNPDALRLANGFHVRKEP